MANLLISAFAKLFSIANERYVDTFVPVERKLTRGKSKIQSKEEQAVHDNLVTTGKNIEKMVVKYPVIKELNEVVFIKVLDLNNFKLTGVLKDGKGEVTVGWDLSKKPSFILPLYSKNLENVKEITQDLDLDLKDVYRITRVMFIPFLKGLYQGDFSYLPKNKSYLKLDNFLHVEVKPYKNTEVEGFPGPAQATILNVDGQWLIFEGLHGDPDIRYSMDLKQALEFAYLVRVKLIHADPNSSWSDLKPTVDRYNKLKKEVALYERNWHTIDEYNKKLNL